MVSGGNAEDIPVGLYLDIVVKYEATDSGNESWPLLHFEVVESGYARDGNAAPLSRCDDKCDRLSRVYQLSGILPWDLHSSQIHKVLTN